MDRATPEAPFYELSRQLEAAGPDAVLDHLAGELRAAGRYHELFDALLMRARRRLELPAVMSQSLEELDEPLREKVEQAYLDACRQVGMLLVEQGKLREAWVYLRPLGEKECLAQALEQAEPKDENLQELIEIALHEGVAPARGFQLLLEHYGVCNAITTFEGLIAARSRAEQQNAAALLLRHVHRELTANVRAHIEREEGVPPTQPDLPALLSGRDWLFGEFSYHLDTTHLAAVVRFARLLERPEELELALELTEYGGRLSSQFQFAGEEPFADLYPAHRLFFAAQLGRQVDEALRLFERKAESTSIDDQGTLPAETYVVLLYRLGRRAEAIDALARFLPAGARTTGFAPSMFEIARASGDFRRFLEICRERGDVVGYAAGLVESQAAPAK